MLKKLSGLSNEISSGIVERISTKTTGGAFVQEIPILK